MVWNTRYAGADCVPAPVRNPLVFENVVMNYVPERTIGPFAIMRRRSANEPVPISFWRDSLGTSLDLGHLGEHSSFKNLDNCREVSSQRCRDFLLLKLPEQEKERLRVVFEKKIAAFKSFPSVLTRTEALSESYTVPVQVADYSFKIVFRVSDPDKESLISLDRVWFWGALKKAGYEPRLGPIPAGLQAQIVRKAPRDDILY
jgi:hypothetical protein